MRNNEISRTEIGSANPFSFLREEEEVNKNTLNLDDTPREEEEIQRKEEIEGAGANPPNPNPPNPTPEEEGKIVGEGEGVNDVEEEEEEEETTAKVKIKTNVTKLLAERLKADGQLPEDFEVTEDTTSSDVENAYRSYLADKVREEEKYNALQDLRTEYGDEQVLETAKKLHYGVPEQEIQLEQVYSTLGTIELDSSTENYEDLTKALFQQYYLDKGLSQDEAEVNAIRDFDDSDDIDALIQKRKNYFGQKSIELSEQHKEQVKLAKEKEQKAKEDNIKLINSYLDKRVIDNTEYAKEDMEKVRKALFEKSETIITENGQRIRVTPYYKKKYERSKNPETALKDVVDFILGYDSTKVEERARKSARKKIVDELNDLIEVDVKVDKPNPIQRKDDGQTIQRKALN